MSADQDYHRNVRENNIAAALEIAETELRRNMVASHKSSFASAYATAWLARVQQCKRKIQTESVK
jgi:hypothetical protein